jgi:NAD(P)-dependent dehydrogenase (short-subunit alcohol dehydrogenase family)
MPTVLVTGAGRGIGLELVRQYSADAWNVIACCRQPAAAAALRQIGGRVEIESLDVASEAAIIDLGRRLKDRSIDVLINNAGIFGPRGGIDVAQWLEVFRVNSIAPYLIARELAEQVARSDRKLIVSLTSRMGSIEVTADGSATIYRSSKAALNMAMKGLSAELKPRGISVVVFHPGWVQTDMGGKEAPLAPADSVAGLRRVIAGIGPAETGRFFNYDGTPIPW